MAKVSFTTEHVVRPTTTDAPTIDVQATVAPAAEIPSAPVTSLVPATPAPLEAPGPFLFNDSKIKLRDVNIPRINLVHNTGGLMKVFTPGEIVLNGTYPLHTPSTKGKPGTERLVFTVLGIEEQQFVEKYAYGSGERGLLFNSEAEVAAIGATLVYREWENREKARKTNPALPEIKLFETLATAVILIERPAHLTNEANLQFPFEFNGKSYVLARYGMKGGAFTRAAKTFYTARKFGFLRNPPGFIKHSWSITTELVTSQNGNTTWQPEVKPGTENSPEFIEFIKDIVKDICGC